MLQFFIGLVVGFLLGVILSCILLAKKNLEMKDNVEKAITKSAKSSVSDFKAHYNAIMTAYDKEHEDD